MPRPSAPVFLFCLNRRFSNRYKRPPLRRLERSERSREAHDPMAQYMSHAIATSMEITPESDRKFNTLITASQYSNRDGNKTSVTLRPIISRCYTLLLQLPQ